MANLKIKPEIFTILNLPFFELVHGYVGKLRIKATLPRIHLHPIKVEVENVFVHVKQKKLSNINKDGEIKFMEGFKNNSLQILEEFKNQLNNFKDELNPDLLSQIINNIEISISNICVRFDDEISYELIPFCFGILIKNIKLKTVDKDFKEAEGKYSIPFGEINNKIIQIENFAIYLDTYENEGKFVEYNKKIVDTKHTKINDEKFKTFLGPMLDYYRYCLSETYEHINNYTAHQYILFNLGLLIRVSINENMKNGKSKFAVSIPMEGIKVELNLVQLKAFMKLSIYKNLMLKYQSGLSGEYYVKKLNEQEKMEYIENYINYSIFMYGKKPNEKKANKIKKILGKVEEGLKYEDIQIMRNAAESKLEHINEMQDIDKQLKEMKSEKLLRKISFKKKTKEEEEEKKMEKQKQIEELEQKKTQLEQKVSDLIKNKLEHIELLSGLLPDASGNFSLVTINLEIPAIQFEIKRDREEKLFTMYLEKFLLFGDLKNRDQNIQLTINDMSLTQYQLPESKYTMIMTTVEQKNENFNEEERKKINACSIEFKNNPEFEKSNFKIKFRNQKRIILIANIYSLQYIAKKIGDYTTFFMDKNFDFPEKFNCSGEIYKLIRDGFKYDSLKISFQHFNADLDVNIKSPIILFPLDIMDNSNKKCILIRCGDFHMSSILPPREDKNINYAEVKEREKVIDTYILKSDKLCVTTLDNFDGDLSLLLNVQGLNLIEDVSFGLFADIMFAQKNEYFEKFNIVMNVGKCRANLRDIQIPFFMELIEKNGKMMKLVVYNLEKKNNFEKKEIKFNKEEEEIYNINKKKINRNIEKNEDKDKNEDKNINRDKNEDKELDKEKNENVNLDEDKNEDKNKNKININENNEIKNEEVHEFDLKAFLGEDNKEKEKKEEEIKEEEIKEEENKEEENKEKEIKEQKIEISGQNGEKIDNKGDDSIKIMEIKKENINENINNEFINIDNIKPKNLKLLIFNFHLENFQFCVQKTISFGEKQILLKTNDENLKNLIYRDFIIFEMDTFKIDLFLTTKFYVNATLLIKSIGVIDKETLITNENNPKGDLYVDKEFQHLIKMDSGNNKNEVDRTISNSSYRLSSDFNREDSIAYNDLNDLENKEINNNINNNIIKEKEKYDQYFMVLKFQHDNEAQIQYADILLKKIKVCISMSTIGRIMKFGLYYLEMFNKIIEKNLILWNNMEMEHKKEKLKNRMIKKLSKNNILSNSSSNENLNLSISDDENEDSDLDEEIEIVDSNKLFDSKFASKLGEDIKNKEKENEDDIFIIDTSSKKNEIRDEINIINTNSSNNIINGEMDKEAEKTLKNKEIKLSKIFRKKNIKLNIKMKFEMKEISIQFPLDDTKSTTKVLRIKSNINGNIQLKTNIDLIRNGNEKLVKINFNENSFKAGVKVFNIELGILNYQNGIYSIDNICDRILSGFRLCLNINSILLLPEREQTVTLVNIDLEPLIFNIGFTQIKSFIKFMPILTEFITDMKKEYDDPIKELESEEIGDIDEDIDDNTNIINEKDKINGIMEEKDLNIISTTSKNDDIINIEKDEKKNKNLQLIGKYKKRRKNKKKKKEKKNNSSTIDGQPEINIVEMNNTIDIKINMGKAFIKIIDDSGYYLKPLLNIEFRETPLKFIINTNSDSVINISNLLLESISRKEISINEYDLKNLALYGKIIFSFSVTYFNNRIEDWEPIIEKYGATITLDQIAWFSRLRILYNSNDMLNINLSYSILCFINEVLKNILTSGEKEKKLNDIATNSDDRIAIEFINLSGIDISCWLDADDDIINNNIDDFSLNHKFCLDSNIDSRNHKKKIKRNRLNKIYKNLTEAQLKIKKDKFSFKVQGFLPIIGNDFSSNYTTCFKLKKDLKDRYIVKNLNIQNEKYGMKINNGMKENNINNIDIIDNNGEENNLLLLKEKLLTIKNEDDNIIDTSSNKKDNLILINEEKEEEEDIEIFIKIRKNGSLKSIVFESNIFFYNNLQIPISLSLISQRDFNNKYNSNDDLIEHENNNNKLIIDSGTRKSISLNYLIKKYRIYISFHDNSNKEKNNYSLLYENFNILKNNNQNFIKYEQENLPTYKGRKETKLKDYYSKLISICHKDKKFYICSNLIIQHGTNDIIKDLETQPNNSSNKNKNLNLDENQKIKNEDNLIEDIHKTVLLSDNYHSKAFSYLFILNESLVIENQLPFNIKCELEGNIKKEVSIRPLQNKYFLDLNNENTQLRLVFKYQKKNFISNLIDIKTIGQNENHNANNRNNNDIKEDIETIVKLFEKENNTVNTNKFIECNIKIEENIEKDKFIGAYEKEFEQNLKSFAKKRKIIIYNKCLIINKTDFLLYIRGNDIRRQDFNTQNYNGKIFQNSVNILNTKDVKNTFRLKTENSDWSNKFNINTIGHIGVISLDINGENNNNNNITELQIGVSISSSWNFPNSLIIIIEPRFLLINKFGYDLNYKQYNNTKDKISNDHGNHYQNQLIKNGEEIKINLLKGNKNMKKMIQIKMPEYSIDYSCPVDLDEIGDVDIKIPINQEMKQKIIKKNLEIKKKIEKLKRKERLKKKFQIIEEKKKEEMKEEDKEKMINNIKLTKEDNNIINTNYNNRINTNNNDIIISENSNNIDNIISSNININNLLNNNINNENNIISNQVIDQNDEKNLDLLSASESEITSTIEDDEMSTDSFSFTKESQKFLSRKGHQELTPNQERLKKIEERNKKLQQVQMKPRKYCIFTQNNQSFLLIRVTKAIYKSLIYIVIFPPELPQYIIKNQTDFSISLRQKKDSFYRENIILEKGGVLPYTWGDSLKNEKLLYVQIDNNDVEINLNEVKFIRKRLKINEQLLLQNNQGLNQRGGNIRLAFFFQTIIENNRTRTLIVKNNNEIENNKISFLERIKEQKKNSFNIKLKLYTKGVGISIINSNPKEIFYISFYGFLMETQLFSFNKEYCTHIIANVRMSLKNFQMDYCLKDLFKSLIIPKNQITPQIEESIHDNIDNNKFIPLFQGIISFHRTINQLISATSDEFPQLDFTIQPIKVNISNYQIMDLVDFALQLKAEFDFYSTEPEKYKKFDNIEDLEKFLLEENSNNNDIIEYDPEHYDPLLNSKLEVLPEEIIFDSEKHYLFFIKDIAIGSVVIILTTRIDLNSIRVIPTIFSGLSSFIGNIFTHITDYKLYLPSLYYRDVFTDMPSLMNQLSNSYVSQLKRRIFKIVGSLDILGNPTGYASSIGQGFLEIFEAPRRGLINGPLGFGEGVAKGFGTFITTIISSSVDIVGKISGTLLASCEELQGIKYTDYLSEREPSNIFSGLYYGVKNGIIDIGKGVAGIFIKPYQEGKKGGFGGFIQGVGAGLIGAAISPVTAGLRITNNLIVGIKNTALIFNPKLKTERFRYPRTIQKAIRLNSYNEDEALIRAILDYLGGYDDHEIIYFKQFQYINPGLQGSTSTLILTDKCVMIVYQAKEIVFKIDLNLIRRVEVHKEPNNTNIDLIFYLRNNTRKYIKTNDLSLCFDFFLMFQTSKE